MEILLEEVPVGDHHARGLAEYAVKSAQGQFRVIKDALESRFGRRVDGERQVAPWMATHTASVVSRGRKTKRDSVPAGGGKGESLHCQSQISENVCCTRRRCQQERTILTSDGKKECGWEFARRVVSL